MALVAAEPPVLVAGLVYGDLVDPGLQRTLATKTGHLAKHLQEHLLHYIGSIRGIVHQPAS